MNQIDDDYEPALSVGEWAVIVPVTLMVFATQSFVLIPPIAVILAAIHWVRRTDWMLDMAHSIEQQKSLPKPLKQLVGAVPYPHTDGGLGYDYKALPPPKPELLPEVYRQPGKVAQLQEERKQAAAIRAEQRERYEPPSTLSLFPGMELMSNRSTTIVAGSTGDGKSTLAYAYVTYCMSRGYELVVIDPHASLNEWPYGIQPVGTGRNMEAINNCLEDLYKEMDNRYKSPTKQFSPLRVIIDEVPLIAQKCPEWVLMSELMMEARKVNISVVMLTQTLLLPDLGFSSALQSGCTIVALGALRQRALYDLSRTDRNFADYARGQIRTNNYLAVVDNKVSPVLVDLTGADTVTTSKPVVMWSGLKVSKPKKVELPAPRKPKVAQEPKVAENTELLTALMANPVETPPLPPSPSVVDVVNEVDEDDIEEEVLDDQPLTVEIAKQQLAGLTDDERRKLGQFVKLLKDGERRTKAIQTVYGVRGGRKYQHVLFLLRCLECYAASK